MIELTFADGCVKVECDGKTIARCDGEADAERIKHALESESLKFLVFAARDEQAKAIEDVLDLADIQFAATGGTRTDTLVAVLTDWRNRVTADDLAKTAEHLAKVDAEGPRGMDDPRTQMHLRLDDDDHRDIMAAVERRKAWDCEPDESDSCEIGGMIAEICRGWMELIEHDQQPKPLRTDNGDGTVTFHGIDVTVCAEMLEGRDVIAVRGPKESETLLSYSGNVKRASGDYYAHEIRVILGPKPQPQQPPAPAFREGGFYRRRNGKLAGPLLMNWKSEYAWMTDGSDGRWDHYASGHVLEDREADADLLPGEVIVWRHPGLRAGEYHWRNGMLGTSQWTYNASVVFDLFADWTDPPSVGRWLVREGQEFATLEGE